MVNLKTFYYLRKFNFGKWVPAKMVFHPFLKERSRLIRPSSVLFAIESTKRLFEFQSSKVSGGECVITNVTI